MTTIFYSDAAAVAADDNDASQKDDEQLNIYAVTFSI